MNPWILLSFAAVAITGAYAVSLIVHPWRPCRPCEGSGRERDLIWRRAFGECPTCGGAGKLPRLGVRVFQHARYARLRKRGRQS